MAVSYKQHATPVTRQQCKFTPSDRASGKQHPSRREAAAAGHRQAFWRSVAQAQKARVSDVGLGLCFANCFLFSAPPAV